MNNKNKQKAVEATVVEALPSTVFRVRLSSGEETLAYLSGKMRMFYIKVLPGDRVLVEIGEGGTRGRIVRRL